jgi:hypothetical protein
MFLADVLYSQFFDEGKSSEMASLTESERTFRARVETKQKEWD